MSSIFGNNKKLNKGDVSVGIDFSRSYSQISYSVYGSDTVETVPMVSGGSDYLIPTVLFKREEVNQWFIGKEALERAEEPGFLIDNLIELAMLGEGITIGEDEYTPAQFVALFLRRIISMASPSFSMSKIVSLMITVDDLSATMVKTLKAAVDLLGLKTKNIFFQNHMESFYYYVIYSPTELWNRNVLLFDFFEDRIKSYVLECNKKTTPIVAYISDVTYDNTDLGFNLTDELSESEISRLDNTFKVICEETISNRLFSSIYLIGNHFKQEHYTESLTYLCRNGRVFSGNNLYSKGACFSALNKVTDYEISNSHVFLGNEKLKSNIGINVYKQGEPVYCPLLDAGINWFEAQVECDVILDKESRLDFVITPLTGKNPRVHEMVLNEFPKRPDRTSRIRIFLKLLSETRVEVSVTDLGFGDLFATSNTEWNEVIEL